MAFVVTVFPSDGVILLPGEIGEAGNPSVGTPIDHDSGLRNVKITNDNHSNNTDVTCKNGTVTDNRSLTNEDCEAGGSVGTNPDKMMHTSESTSVKRRIDGGDEMENSNGHHHHCSTMEVNHNTIIVGEDKRKEAEEGASRESRMVDMAVKLLVCLFCGMVMGLALEKGRVFEPRSIRCQFTYQVWIMMKMFLSALATGLLCLGTMSVLPFTKRAFDDARVEYLSCLTTKGIMNASIGGMLLGAGMALSGACPGMVLAQVGAWVGHGSGLVTFCGSLVGAFTYGLCHPFISKTLGRSSPLKRQVADDWLSHVPFAGMAFFLGIVIAGIVTGIEFWRPWRTEILPSLAGDFQPTWFMAEYAWPPYVAGTMIGLLQIPLVLIIKDTIGGSSSYCTISSQVLVTKRMEEAVPYLAKFKRGIASWWQVFFVSGVILGAMTSSLLSHTFDEVAGVGWGLSFLGGFVMLFGARFAGGCTSGHGISGVGVLALLSFVAVAAMFLGGTMVGVIGWGIDKSDVIESFTYCPL